MLRIRAAAGVAAERAALSGAHPPRAMGAAGAAALQAADGGQLTIQYTGHHRRRIRGESLSKAVRR